MAISTFILILANLIISWKGFNDRDFFHKYKFQVRGILQDKEYLRGIVSGFLHGGWPHLIFNMFTLFFFGKWVEVNHGPEVFLLIYFASLIGADLLALFVYRNQPEYSAIGASGAVSGILFAYVILNPEGSICLYGFICLPAWVYAIAYTAYTLYGIRSKKDNIGHEAHLGGALIGIILGVVFNLSILKSHLWLVLILIIPVLIFFYVFFTDSGLKFWHNIGNPFKQKPKTAFIHKRDYDRETPQQELDRLLDKIAKRGFHTLTKEEKHRLNELSTRLNKKKPDSPGESISDSDHPGPRLT